MLISPHTQANYQFSFYVAELVNTFSNLYSIALAVYGVLNIIRQSLPPVYTIGFIVCHFIVDVNHRLILGKGFCYRRPR